MQNFSQDQGINQKTKPPLFRLAETDDLSESLDFKKIFSGIQRHGVLILTCTVVFFLLGSYLSYRFLTTYQATAIVLYQPVGINPEREGPSLTPISMPTALDMILMETNLQAVKSLLGLSLEPGSIKAMVDIPDSKNNSNLININVKSKYPMLAQDIANTLASAARKNSQDFVQRQLKVALQNYTNQLNQLKEKLVLQIQDLENFKTAHQYFEMTAENTSLLNQIDTLREKRDQAELNYNQVLVEYENLKREVQEMPDYVAMSNNASNTSPMQNRIFTLESALAEAKARYTDDNPKVKLLELELKELIGKSKDPENDDQEFYQRNMMKGDLELELLRLQGKVRSSQKTKQQLQQTTQKIEEQLQNLPQQQMALVKLLQAKEITENQVKSMTDALESIKLQLGNPRGSLEIYQLASGADVWHGEWWVGFIPFLTLLFGLGTGVFFSFILEVMDSKIRTPKQLQLLYNIPCFASIYEIPFLSEHNGEKKLKFFMREIFARLTRKKTPKIIALTSSFQGEGKSILSLFFAKYISEVGKKVLLLNFQEKNIALSDIDSMIEAKSPDRLTLGNENLNEYVQSQAIKELLVKLQGRYDVIVIDAPAVLDESAATSVVNLADASLFIIASSSSSKVSVDQSLSTLDTLSKRPDGILLNRIQPIYIQDERVRLQMKKERGSFLNRLFRRG